jgi:hypothetical protein
VFREQLVQARHVTLTERHRPATRNAARRVREAHEPFAVRGLEQLDDRGEPPLTRLLPNGQLLEELSAAPRRCRLRCRLRCRESDATPEGVTAV